MVRESLTHPSRHSLETTKRLEALMALQRPHFAH
jgi:hypothetical protein